MNHKSHHKFLKNTSLFGELVFTGSVNYQTKIVDSLSIYKESLNMLCWYMTIVQPSRNIFVMIKFIIGGFHKISRISNGWLGKINGHLLWVWEPHKSLIQILTKKLKLLNYFG